MTILKIEKDIVAKRMEGIEAEITELKKLSEQDFDVFSNGDGWKLAQFHLHRSLEGVFNIGNHILSRIPGATATEYKEIAEKLGEYKIVPLDFAKENLVKMAKYRNRVVHFYAQITPEELYKIIANDLGDFEKFLSAIKNLLINPSQYGLETE
jgi:uncharacterized protein YutE (UPF0331/DUF86 family)